MLWGKGNRFTAKELLSTGPDPAVDRGSGPPSSPALVNFTDYVRKQLVQSKQFFKASNIWSDQESEIPLAKSAPVNVLEKPSIAKKASSKEKSKKKGKHKRASRSARVDQHASPSHQPTTGAQWEMSAAVAMMEQVELPTVVGQTAEFPGGDELRLSFENLRATDSRPEDNMEEKQVIHHSPPKIKPIKIMKKKIYTSPCTPINDIPGPGTYNIAGSLIKPTFNRVYSEPPPALPESTGPSYLRHTTASHCRNIDFPTNFVPEKDSIVVSPPVASLLSLRAEKYYAAQSNCPAIASSFFL